MPTLHGAPIVTLLMSPGHSSAGTVARHDVSVGQDNVMGHWLVWVPVTLHTLEGCSIFSLSSLWGVVTLHHRHCGCGHIDSSPWVWLRLPPISKQ